MKSKPDWFKVPISEFPDAAEGGAEDYGLTGTAYVMNSETHKYFRVFEECDRKVLEARNGVERVSADVVTRNCRLSVSADTFVSNEIEGNDLGRAGNGLGDRLSRLLRTLGVRRSCAQCDSRRTWLNNLFAAKS